MTFKYTKYNIGVTSSQHLVTRYRIHNVYSDYSIFVFNKNRIFITPELVDILYNITSLCGESVIGLKFVDDKFINKTYNEIYLPNIQITHGKDNEDAHYVYIEIIDSITRLEIDLLKLCINTPHTDFRKLLESTVSIVDKYCKDNNYLVDIILSEYFIQLEIDDTHYRKIIENMLHGIGLEIDETTNVVDRVNQIKFLSYLKISVFNIETYRNRLSLEKKYLCHIKHNMDRDTTNRLNIEHRYTLINGGYNDLVISMKTKFFSDDTLIISYINDDYMVGEFEIYISYNDLKYSEIKCDHIRYIEYMKPLIDVGSNYFQ